MKCYCQNLNATESLFSSVFLLSFLAWFFQFSCCNLNQISRWNFYHFPLTVVFQQENEIPVNVQQDSCSNQVIIFVREVSLKYLWPFLSYTAETISMMTIINGSNSVKHVDLQNCSFYWQGCTLYLCTLYLFKVSWKYLWHFGVIGFPSPENTKGHNSTKMLLEFILSDYAL